MPREEDRPSRRVRYVVVGVLALLLVGLAALAVSALSWRSELVAGERLLPGTTIADVPVGGATVGEARAAVGEVMDGRLHASITVVDGDRQWQVTPAELGVTADIDGALAQASQRTRDAGLVTLFRMRFLGWEAARPVDVPAAVRDASVAAFIREIAKDVDVAAADAVLTWDGASFVIEPSVTARTVDRAAASAAVHAAVQAGDVRVELPVDVEEPAVPTELATATSKDLEPLVLAALRRRLTASVEDHRWTATAGELGAAPDLEALLPMAFEQEVSDIPLAVDRDVLSDFVTGIAADVHVPARSAKGSWSDGRLHATDHHVGRSLDIDAAATALTRAITDGSSSTQLQMRNVTPALTKASWNTFVLVNQRNFTVTLYRNESVVKSWPIAVGAEGYRTPNGNFVVGSKRFEPTWTNPAPTTWGKDSPAFIGPGPNNPLGLRALNWNRVGGGDTLIRFHGTPARDSIGTAASHGCVRMLNEHAIELYDLVPTGTPILAIGTPPPPPPPDEDEDGDEDPGPDDEDPPTEGA